MKDKELKIARYDDDATEVTAAVSGQVDCIGSSATIINQIGVKNSSRVFEFERSRLRPSISPSA